MEEYFATIYNGKITAVFEAFPQHELKPNQIALTKAEFDFLKKYTPAEAKSLLAAINKKVKRLEP